MTHYRTLAAVAALTWTGAAWAAGAAAVPGDAAAGRRAFTPCASCHQVGPSARAGFGPALDGVVGRPAGTNAGANADFAYSAAMKNSRIVWSEATIAAFVKDADRVVPGTKMRFSSFGYDDRKIADIVAYLKTFPASVPPVSTSR